MMAVDLTNLDQLFPPLLQSQILPQDKSNFKIKTMTKSYSSCFSSSGFGSISSSPVESEHGSTESDQDDDDYIAELTLKMAQYMLQDDDTRLHEHDQGCSEEWPKLDLIKHEFQKVEQDNTDQFLSKKQTTPNLDFHSKQALIDEQIRNFQLDKQKQERIMKQEQDKGQFYENKRRGSEMRAVFLGESAGSCGTGVFLPRPNTNPNNNSRKKAGCSTVLIPARVLQALQLHFDRRMSCASKDSGAAFLKLNDGRTGNVRYGQKQKKSQSQKTKNNKEIGLPQEWTY